MRTRRLRILAAALAFASPAVSLAASNVPPETLDVKVFADRYVAAGRHFADLKTLHEWARPIVIREVWLDGCGPAAAQSLQAASLAFQPQAGGLLRVRMLSPVEAGCGLAAPARAVAPADEQAYLASDAAGRSILP